MVDPPGPSSPPLEPADSPAQFCVDFAALLDARGVSLRAAERAAGWGKSTIAAARKGPDLPNVDLVVDVLQGIGEPEPVLEQWRERHQRLNRPPAWPTATTAHQDGDEAPRGNEPTAALDDPTVEPAQEVAAEPASASASELGPEPASGAEGAEAGTDVDRRVGSDGGTVATRRWSRRRLIAAAVAAGVVLVAVGGLLWWLLGGQDQPTPQSRTIVVQNKVAFGPTDLEEDRSPSYLAARPIERCANVPGCKLAGTDLGSGDTVKAVCQLQGALLTNADVQSTGVKDNPNVAASALWYGIRWPDGRLGYLSEVYVAPMYRGGLQLPPC